MKETSIFLKKDYNQSMLGSSELLVILAIIVILFGASAIPKLAKSIGKAKKEFEKGMKEAELETDEEKGKSKD